MATLQDLNQDPNAPQNPVNAPSTGGSGATGTSQGGQTSAGASSVNQQPVSPVQQNINPQNGAGYTDVASYLNANQNGGNQLGQQVASNLTSKYDTTKQGIDTSAAKTNSDINAGYIPENTQLIQQVASNPNAAASDPNQVSNYQAQLNDSYSGPSTWSDLGTQQGNVNDATQYGNLLNTPGGNNVLVQDVENKLNPGQTSQGINSLDTLLFGGNPNAVSTAKSAAAPIQSLNDYINSQNTAIGSNISGAQANAAKTSQDALDAFTGSNGTLTNLNNTINSDVNTQLSQAQAQQAALKGDIANLYGGVAQNNDPSQIGSYGGNISPWYNTQNYTVGQLSPQDLQSLGITQDQWNQLQGSLQGAATSTGTAGNAPGSHNFGAWSPTSQIDIGQFLQQQDPTKLINASTVATPEQYQQMAAIQTLLGSKTPQGAAINPLNANRAGTYNPGQLNSFDYNAALSNTQNLGSAEQKAALDEANALNSGADAAHAASKHGSFLNNFLDTAKNYALNPLSVVPQEINAVKSKV